MSDAVAGLNFSQLNDVERQYAVIESREKTIKIINNIAFIIFVVSVAFLLFYPCYSIGGEKFNIFTFFVNNLSNDGIEKEIETVLQPIFKDVILFELLLVASIWYIALKAITFVFSFIFKGIFGGLIRLFKGKEVKIVASRTLLPYFVERNKPLFPTNPSPDKTAAVL